MNWVKSFETDGNEILLLGTQKQVFWGRIAGTVDTYMDTNGKGASPGSP